jgi:hypothetical protein
MTKRQLQAEIRRRKKEVLPRLRAAIAAAKKEKKRRVKGCRANADEKLKVLRKKQKGARVAMRKHLKKMEREFRKAANACRAGISAATLDQVEKISKQIENENAEIMRLRREADAMVSPRRRAAGRKAAERESESADEVRRNLDDAFMLELWEKRKSKIRGSKHRTRTEAFLEYVKNHPEELEELVFRKERAAERSVERAFEERAAGRTCDLELDDCQRELERLREALRLAEATPF